MFFFFQAEDGIRDRSPSRGLGDVYKRQKVRFTIPVMFSLSKKQNGNTPNMNIPELTVPSGQEVTNKSCLLYTSDAADEEDSVDLGGRRIIKKKTKSKKKKKTNIKKKKYTIKLDW